MHIISRNKMPQIVRVMTALKLKQALCNRRRGIRYSVVLLPAVQQFLMDLLDDVGHRIALAYKPGLCQMLLQAGHISKDFGLLERLDGLRLQLEEIKKLIPNIRLCFGSRGLILANSLDDCLEQLRLAAVAGSLFQQQL